MDGIDKNEEEITNEQEEVKEKVEQETNQMAINFESLCQQQELLI